MALIKFLNACCLLGRNNSLGIFSFWFDEDVISLYKNCKCLPKTDERQKHNTNKERYS